MRTQVKIVTPSEHWALRARPGECAAPRHVDVVDARANMRTVHLQAKGRVPQEVRRWLSTILREAEAHLRSGGPLRLTRAGAHAKRNRHGAVPIKRDTRRPRGNETRPPGVPLPSLAKNFGIRAIGLRRLEVSPVLTPSQPRGMTPSQPSRWS